MDDKLRKHWEDLTGMVDRNRNEYKQLNQTFLHSIESLCNSFMTELETGKLDATPKRNKKKKLSQIVDIGDDENEVEQDENVETTNVVNTSIRPSRTAKSKANTHLKEVHLNTKMRRDGDAVVIKVERVSTPPNICLPKVVENTAVTINDVEIKRKQTETDDVLKKKVKLSNNDSVVHIPTSDVEIELTSDDETDKMPPPPVPVAPQSTRGRKQKNTLSKTSEKVSTTQSSESLSISVDKTTIKAERISTVAEPEARPKRTRNAKKAANKPDNIKNSIVEDETIAPNSQQIDETNVKNETSLGKSTSKNTTLESVYEDAKDQVPISNLCKSISVSLTKLNFENPINGLNKSQATGDIGDFTFNVPTPPISVDLAPVNETFVMETECPSKSNNPSTRQFNDETVVIEGHVSHSSLITEDASDDEIFEKPVKPPPPKKIASSKLPYGINVKNKKIHEIFDPLIQSPVKKKVEAYENHTNIQNMASPIKQRVTRTKTRANNNSESSNEQQATPSTSKAGTPIGESKEFKYSTPTSNSTYISTLVQNLKKPFSSTSKLAHVTGHVLKTSSASKSSSTSRDNSIEDLKRGANQLQLLAEEKKRKREEKQRLAQQQREALERERIEQAEKMVREREEKHRKLLEEKERQRQEVIRKKEKRQQEAEQRKKLEEQKRLLRQQAAEAEEQQKLKAQNELEEQTRREQEKARQREIARMKQMRNISIIQQQILLKKSDFDDLCTDDSTDDENDPVNPAKKKLPHRPKWSASSHRLKLTIVQSSMPLNVVDAFFSVKPITPDIREMFPNIDERYTKRNSSVIWSTPPRYSELPKY